MATREELIIMAVIFALTLVLYNLKSIAFALLKCAAIPPMIWLAYYLIDKLLTKITDYCLFAVVSVHGFLSPSDQSPITDEACFTNNSRVPPGAYPIRFTDSYTTNPEQSTPTRRDGHFANHKKRFSAEEDALSREKSAAEIRELKAEISWLKARHALAAPRVVATGPPCACGEVDVQGLERRISHAEAKREEECHQAQSELCDLKERLSLAKKQVKKQSVRFAPTPVELESEVAKLKAQLAEASLRIHDLQMLATSTQDTPETTPRLNVALAKQVKALKTQLADKTEEPRSATARLKNELCRVNDELAATKTTLESTTTQLQQVTADLSSIGSNAVSLDAFKSISEDLATARNTISAYVVDLETSKKATRHWGENYDKAVNTIQSEFKPYVARIEAENKNLKYKILEEYVPRGELLRKEAELGPMNQELLRKAARIAALEQDIGVQKGKHNAEYKYISNEVIQLRASNKIFRDAARENIKLEAEMTKKNSQIKELTEKLASRGVALGKRGTEENETGEAKRQRPAKPKGERGRFQTLLNG